MTAAVDMGVSTAGGMSSPMVAALEMAWAAIQTRHPELPAVVMVLGAGSGNGPGLTLGHFAAMRWRTPAPATLGHDPGNQDQHNEEEGQHNEDGGAQESAGPQRWAEVFVGGEGLARGPADVLATLLHEAAHALAHMRGVKDTSRQGRWHNARFKALAEEVGISVEKDPRIGWSPTTLPTSTRATYAQVIAELGLVLRLHRAVETSAGAVKKPTTPPCVCGCGRKIRVSKSVLAAGPIVCGICGTEFTPDDDGGENRDGDDSLAEGGE